MEPFIGQIMMFAGNFAPRGWALCNGQLLPISQNAALFSILGTTYGGDGQTTFALPNLQGRFAMHPGAGPGLTPRTFGESDGSEAVTLLTNQIPTHNHLLSCNSNAGNQGQPEGNVMAAESASATHVYTTEQPNQTMNPVSIGPAGGGQPHDNMPPFQCVNYIIALEGIFPSRN